MLCACIGMTMFRYLLLSGSDNTCLLIFILQSTCDICDRLILFSWIYMDTFPNVPDMFSILSTYAQRSSVRGSWNINSINKFIISIVNGYASMFSCYFFTTANNIRNFLFASVDEIDLRNESTLERKDLPLEKTKPFI